MTEYITTGEAAELLDIDADSVTKALRRRRIQGKKFGNTWMVDKESVLEYREDRRQKPKEAEKAAKAAKK